MSATTYYADDTITTRDGQQWRVIYQAGDKVYCKSVTDKKAKAKMIEVAKITNHTKRKVPA